MWKKALTVSLTLLLATTFAAPVLAMEEGNKRKGKYTYRKVYKACYERGEVTQEKPPINPDAHTQAEWKSLFEARNFEAFGCAEEWKQLDDEAISDIYAYLYNHASDSPTPLKCK
jgi:hypothetical protein